MLAQIKPCHTQNHVIIPSTAPETEDRVNESLRLNSYSKISI